jgi:hypothetical protein
LRTLLLPDIDNRVFSLGERRSYNVYQSRYQSRSKENSHIKLSLRLFPFELDSGEDVTLSKLPYWNPTGEPELPMDPPSPIIRSFFFRFGIAMEDDIVNRRYMVSKITAAEDQVVGIMKE